MDRSRIILHIDMNSYFASVEQQANPFLRNRSVGVCAYLSPGGCIIASSMEAKAKGIKTGCTVREAKLLDPKVILVENEPAKYRTTTEEIFSILKEYSDRIEPYSIDEAFVDLSGWVDSFKKAEELGFKIQERIKTKVGIWLNSSVGISWTKFLAKFASDIAPKKSLLMIDTRHKLCGLLKNRPLTDAWGINTRMDRRLNMLGVKDLLDLKNTSPDRLRYALGRYGYYLWANVNGEEITEVNEGIKAPKSIGHSYCLPKKTNDKEYLRSVLYKLCEKTGRRLRSAGLEAKRMNVFFAFIREGGTGKNYLAPERMYTTPEIFRYANHVLDVANLCLPVSMIAVSVGRLKPLSSQLSFFDDKVGEQALARALDELNNKYGEYTVMAGQMFNLDKAAVDRIGFRKTLGI